MTQEPSQPLPELDGNLTVEHATRIYRIADFADLVQAHRHLLRDSDDDYTSNGEMTPDDQRLTTGPRSHELERLRDPGEPPVGN